MTRREGLSLRAAALALRFLPAQPDRGNRNGNAPQRVRGVTS